MEIEETEFNFIIDSIDYIFERGPRVDKSYMCHGEYHFYTTLDRDATKQKLREFLQKYFKVKNNDLVQAQKTSKVKLFGENIKEAIKIFKNFSEQKEPPSIPKHGILKRGM